MERLFSYGTLQMEEVQQALFGRLLTGTKDMLLGYVIAKLNISDKDVVAKSGTDVHPILRWTGESADEIEGVVFEITAEELERADSYEVKEYARTQAHFKSGKIAWVYAAADHMQEGSSKNRVL